MSKKTRLKKALKARKPKPPGTVYHIHGKKQMKRILDRLAGEIDRQHCEGCNKQGQGRRYLLQSIPVFNYGTNQWDVLQRKVYI
jgi:hypothetical protein